MASAGCGKCAQGFLFVFNMLLFFAGLVPLVIGIIALVDESVFNQILASIPGSSAAKEMIRNSAAFLIVLGVIVLAIGLLGWISSCYKAKGILYLYLSLLLLVIALEVAIIVIAVVFPSTFSAAGQALMLKSLNGLQDCQAGNGTVVCPQTDAKWLGWHAMQFELRCCGAKDYTDFNAIDWTRRVSEYSGGQPVLAPLTCCNMQDGSTAGLRYPPLLTSESNCYDDGTTRDEYVSRGCFDAVLKWVVTSSLFIIILSVIGGLEIIVFLATIVLLCDKSMSKVGHSDNPHSSRFNGNRKRVHWQDDYYY